MAMSAVSAVSAGDIGRFRPCAHRTTVACPSPALSWRFQKGTKRGHSGNIVGVIVVIVVLLLSYHGGNLVGVI